MFLVLSLFLPPSRQEHPMCPTDRNRFRKDAEARFAIKIQEVWVKERILTPALLPIYSAG